ncbi:TPA: hypothetical protein ACXIGC_004559, partial [Stenotrophomonas maltophilia]
MVTDELKKNKKDAAFAASFLFDSAVLSVELKAAAGAAANVACATARRVPVRTTGTAMLGCEQAKRATRCCSSFFLPWRAAAGTCQRAGG